jgi:hypothetical protein
VILDGRRLTDLRSFERPGPPALVSDGVTVSVPSDAGASTFQFSYASIHGQSNPSAALDRYFNLRAKYLFAILGDPGAGVPQLYADDAGTRNPEYKGRGLHVVAFPVAPLGTVQ